jgi:hypothetical protein
VIVGANRIRPIFILAIFILDGVICTACVSGCRWRSLSCQEGSTQRCDGSPGRSLGEIVMEVRDATSVKFRENIKQGECDSPQR